MTDLILLVLLVLIFVFAGKGAFKHMKGEGACCGGGSTVKAKKKKLKGTIIATRVILIDGMHCDHCKNSVERALNALDGVAARVNLKKKQAVVRMTSFHSDEELKTAVERAGFTVTEIKEG